MNISAIVENVALAGILGGFTYVFMIQPKKKTEHYRKALKSDKLEDLMYYEKIREDGLVILPNNRFRIMVEVIPKNLGLESKEEQALSWQGYGNMHDSIECEKTEITQTRQINLNDYFASVKAEAEKIRAYYPELANQGIRTVQEMAKNYEDSVRRERRQFIMFKIDEDDISIKEASGVQTEIDSLNALTGRSGKKLNLSQEEILDLTEKEFQKSIDMVKMYLSKQNLTVYKLNKIGILDYLNNTINRDMAVVQSVENMNKGGVLNISPVSRTREMYLEVFKNQELIQANYKGNEEELFYPDENTTEV